MNIHREAVWFEWIRAGFGEPELRLVVAHLQRKIRSGERRPECLKFSNLIGNPDFFEEDLAMARAVGRIQPVDRARADVMRATGRPVATPQQTTGGAVPAAQVIAGLRAALKGGGQ